MKINKDFQIRDTLVSTLEKYFLKKHPANLHACIFLNISSTALQSPISNYPQNQCCQVFWRPPLSRQPNQLSSDEHYWNQKMDARPGKISMFPGFYLNPFCEHHLIAACSMKLQAEQWTWICVQFTNYIATGKGLHMNLKLCVIALGSFLNEISISRIIPLTTSTVH